MTTLAEQEKGAVKRCKHCDWPIVPEGESGCWESNCSMRPMPSERTPSQQQPASALVEAYAKEIYRAMQWAAKRQESGNPPDWSEGGNSHAQTEARRCAKEILTRRQPGSALVEEDSPAVLSAMLIFHMKAVGIESSLCRKAAKNIRDYLITSRQHTREPDVEAGARAEEWQLIESAPQDGTTIDVWTGNSEFPNRHTDVSWRKPTDSEFWVHGSSEPDAKEGTIGLNYNWFGCLGWALQGDESPTHWMPRPTSPQAGR